MEGALAELIFQSGADPMKISLAVVLGAQPGVGWEEAVPVQAIRSQLVSRLAEQSSPL